MKLYAQQVLLEPKEDKFDFLSMQLWEWSHWSKVSLFIIRPCPSVNQQTAKLFRKKFPLSLSVCCYFKIIKQEHCSYIQNNSLDRASLVNSAL